MFTGQRLTDKLEKILCSPSCAVISKRQIKNALLLLPFEVPLWTSSEVFRRNGNSPFHFLFHRCKHTLSLYIAQTACCWPHLRLSRWCLFSTTWQALRRRGKLLKKKKTFNLLQQLQLLLVNTSISPVVSNSSTPHHYISMYTYTAVI